MATQPRQQGRAELTRARLIQSAEKIFARDGFEVAKLEEIAADAGYTRGAFYANFESKEDLFFALLEQEISSRITALERAMAKVRDPEAKLATMREFFLAKAIDRRWSLLSLEFKLFAVRHPDVKRRLAAMHRRFVEPRVCFLEEVMKALGAEMHIPAYAIGVSLATMGNALALEHMLDPASMREQDVRQIMTSFFDGLMAAPNRKKLSK
ncbi:MAG TPA: TetR family transcriptional regulator [Candidatus Angelobacter sp.]|jgi:AcrR family transcriptional regulator|nr:TetR family transcriptional regulator [Candidatus Angelobacter sp.]